jgi:hypothetical protein
MEGFSLFEDTQIYPVNGWAMHRKVPRLTMYNRHVPKKMERVFT